MFNNQCDSGAFSSGEFSSSLENQTTMFDNQFDEFAAFSSDGFLPSQETTMFNNQFDEFAAFSGDGFLPSQANQTPMNGVSPAKNRDSQGWLPLTVKQLSDFSISGVDVCNVRLVGMVFNKMESINEVTFMLDDKTSQVDCHRWVNDNIASKEMAEIKDGTFAEIQGTLKGFKGEKHLEAFSVRPVTDIDELAHLFRECMYVHCHNNKSQGQISNSAQPQMTNAAITNGSVSYQTAPSNQICWQPTSVGINQKVLDFLSIPAQMELENGVHMEELAQHLKVPLGKIKEALATLEEEGTVYPTIDKYHYKSFEEPVTDLDQVAQPQMTNAAITNGTSSYQTACSDQFYRQPTSVGINRINQKVLDFLSIPADMELENGVHMEKLAQHLKVPPCTIKEALATLGKEGAVYQTIDEYHYKSFEGPVTDINWQATLDGISRKVLDCLDKPVHMKRENGVQLEELSCYLRVPLEKIMKAIRHLEQEGVVYSTIDKFHYKSVS